MNEDAADRQSPLHAGGHWRDTAGLNHEGSGRQALPSNAKSEYDIKFDEQGKRSVSQQTFAIFVADLFIK